MIGEVCLLVVYNHRYDANISKINRIYEGRFSKVYHVMPFYEGDEPNVITVYESSFCFEGYLAQALLQIPEEYSYYLYVADDIVLNPQINERNYRQWFGLNGENAFLPFVKSMNEMGAWSINRDFMDPLIKFERYKGTLWKNEILPAEDAFEIAKERGYDKDEFCVDLSMVWNARKKIRDYPRLVTLFFKILVLGKQYSLYPIWGGYSDIVIIPGNKMKQVAHMLGVFAALGIFVEMAIPTATMLLCNSIVEEKNLNTKALVFWSNEERINIEKKYNNQFDQLLKDWKEDCLYIHPVKLSSWEKV